MKRRFTILSAALALLAFLAIPMGMWGQTRTTQTASYGFETGDTGWTATSFATNNTAITAHGGSKYGATNGGSTANVKYDALVANPQSLTCYYSKTTTNTNAGSHFEIQVSTNNSTWTKVAEGLGMDKVTKGTWYELTADLSSYSNVYVRVYYTGTSAVRALDDITLTYDDGNTPSTDPEITFTPASITLGEVLVGNEVSTTFSVSQANLTSGITLSVDNGSLSPSSITQGAAATTVTWTYTPTTAGAISATVTASSGTTSETLAISGTAIAPVEGYDINFEYAENLYQNWTFNNMTTYQTGSITAHGGTYYGTTGGKATASVTTASTVASPGTLTCYVSKQSNNTNSSTWYIQVSSDGSNWTDVETQSATSMSQGSWVEFSADLSSYTNVYVRVYYSGSTAVRNIDDLTLTIRSSVADPTFNPASGTTFGDEGLSVTISQADNQAIYYTLDGTDPTTSSTLYSGAISLTATTTIKAFAYDGTNYSNVATATYTYVDPNAPGTVNNPYSVSQAIDNTPSSGTSDNVYIHGIVSRFHNNSIVGDGSNYRYYISDDGTTNTELLVFKGKGLNNVAFSNVNDLLVGDVVTIYGGLTTYNGTKEIAANNYIVSLVRPTPTVEAPSFSPVAGTYTETQNVTISCATTDANIYYTTDGTEPTSASTPYTSAIAVSTTTTIKAIAYVGNAASTVATATYHFCSAEDPYTVTEALAFNEYPANGIYVHGIVSTAPTSLSNGTLTYYISVDGNATNQLEVYKGKDIGNENFTSVDDIQVGDIVTVYGNIQIYNSTFEFAQGNYLVSFERPTTPAQEYTLTVDDPAHVTFTAGYGTDGALTNGENDDIEEGTLITLTVTVDAGYLLDGITVTGANSQSVTLTETSTQGVYTFNMPAFNATISATTIVAPATTTYTLATSIESGKQYIIVGQANGDYYAMGNDKGDNRYAYGITLNGTTATAIVASGNNVHEFTITSLATPGFYSICDATTPGYLYAASSNKNQLKTEDELDSNHNGDWEITINAETGVASVVASQSGNRNVMQFNNSAILFNCYSSASQHPVYLYVKDETPVTESFPLPIEAWGPGSGWYLISSPIGDVDPTEVENMITDDLGNNSTPSTGTYDLYAFNQEQNLEWDNYRAGAFNLAVGHGYLYAHASENAPLIFTGTAYTDTGEFDLIYSNANSDAYMHGWNLVGNPFPVNATVTTDYDLDLDFMQMNDTHTDIMTGSGNVTPMEGIFVHATGADQHVIFTPSDTKATRVVERTWIELCQNDLVVDRASIRYGEGTPLPKIQLNENNTKIYFPMEDGDYAVIIGDYQDEVPLNFMAATAGTYTLNFTNQNAEFNTLILVDNQTNTQVNLLNNPSYSFSAQTTDDEARFTVVYQRASSYLTIGTGDLYSASGNNSSDSTKDGMGSPVGNTYYTASTAQFIYMASEMEGAKTIRSLAFYHNNQGPFVGTVKIYLAHTSASQVYTSNPATSGTLVYEGTNINIGSSSAGWQTFTLDTPFPYNGTDNLLVVVCRTKATSGSPNYHTDQGWKYTSYSQHYYYMQRSGNGNDTYGNITTTGNYARGFKRPNIKIGYTAPTVNHFYLDIDGWTSSRNNYYLIASPIGQVAPTAVDNMLSNTYDLFYFDQDGDDEGYEWMTYKPGNGATDPGFDLVPGKGYLYANSGVAGNNPNVVTLTFTGWGYTGSGQVDLIYSEANSDSNMHGWNLVGNPFGVEAYIDRPFYRMNEEGSELNGESETGSIGIMEGVFVYTTQNETMTFTTTPSGSKGSMVALNLSKDRKVIDRAIVRFGEGKQLPKFQLNRNNTKLYIPQDNKDYAIVCAEEQGEMPVSFKAEDNGIYNLNFSSENVEFAYLHLIDNMTGTDVDLLQTPSYSFEAKTTDYASRFKLVFATGDNSTSDTFAFFSNGSFVINNEGNATLQVIDVTGRILKSESINGCANVDVNAAPGVYMLRLVNGDNVKIQKVVVK